MSTQPLNRNVFADTFAEVMAIQLCNFRLQIEMDAGVENPLTELSLNVALLLGDLADFLNLGSQAHDYILGEPAATFTR